MRMTRTGWYAALAALLAVGCGSSSDTTGTGAGPGTGTGGAGGQGGGGGGAAPLTLAPGEVAELAVDGSGVAGARLATPNGDEQFVLVLGSMKLDRSGSLHDYAIDPQSAPPAGTGSLATGCSLSNDPWSSTPLPNEPPPTGTGPTQGDIRSFDVPTSSGYETISAQAIAVGNVAVVWGDTTAAHPANLDAAFVQQFLTDFEQIILPRERTVFGIESDVDGDGHIALVFSPLTYQTGVAFFSGCDLKDFVGCPPSNGSEILYLTPPDAIDPPYNTANAIKEILAHELSHMIHFNRKVLRNNLSNWADSMNMDEGVGALAQDTSGSQAGNLFVAKAGLDGIDVFSLGDILVNNAPYDPSRNGPLRGGGYFFVRWLYDRAGGDQAPADGSIVSTGGPAFLRTLLDAPETIADKLPPTAGSSAEDLATDFYTTLAMSNREDIGGVAPPNGCFAFLPTATDPLTTRQRGADVYAVFFGNSMNGPVIQPAASADGSLRAGGVDYVEIDANAASPELDFTVTIDPAARPRVRVGRIR